MAPPIHSAAPLGLTPCRFVHKRQHERITGSKLRASPSSRRELKYAPAISWNGSTGISPPHTPTGDNNNRWDPGSLRNKATGRWTTTQPGEFAYHCAFHPHMKGVIIVVDP